MSAELARICLAWMLLVGATYRVHAHGVGPWDAELLHWHDDQISRVVGGGSPRYSNPHTVEVAGKNCVAGRLLSFDVRDQYAFDIDETVQVDIEFYKDVAPSSIRLTYDRSDGAPAFNSNVFVGDALVRSIELPTTALGLWRVTVPLVRARFSNGGFAGTDFTLSGSQ